MVLVAVQAEDIQLQRLGPMIEAVPVELAAKLTKAGVELLTSLFDAQAVLFCVVLRHMMQPHVVVECEIQQGAIHVQHQGLTAFKHA